MPLAPPVTIAQGAVPEGKVADFLTGKHVRDTREEYVRQNLEKALVRQYGFDPADCAPEFKIKVGSSRRYVDIAVFEEGAPHTQENIVILVEAKKLGTSPSNRADGIGQLQSYMAACLNATYGLWTNGEDRYCFAKRVVARGFRFDEIIDIPGKGQSELEA